MLRSIAAISVLFASPAFAAERLPPFGVGARVGVDSGTIECREPADAAYALAFAAKHSAAEAGRFMADIGCGSGPPTATTATVRDLGPSAYDVSCVQQDDEPVCLWVPNVQLRRAAG